MAQADHLEHELGDEIFRRRFDAAVAEIDTRRREGEARRWLWLSHHHPDQYDRCTRVGARHVCRRCVTLYPVAFVFATLTLVGWSVWPESLDLWFIWLPCIPVTVDFVLEQLGVVRYSPRRQFLTTLAVAPALGRGIGHELEDSFSWELWGPVVVFCTIWFFAALAGRGRNGPSGPCRDLPGR